MFSQDRLLLSRRGLFGFLGATSGLAAATGLLGPLAVARSAENGTLNVSVEGIRNNQGSIRIALWSTPEAFTKGELAQVKDSAVARVGEVVFSFGGLHPGPYALASYHDEDDDVTFDQSWIGLPAEGLGFSNDAWIEFGPPSFEEAMVKVGPGPQWTRISLRY